jgi:hypothetical protein
VVKVHCGGPPCQPLAKGKGVHREVEFEGSWRQNSDLRNTNIMNRCMSIGQFEINIDIKRDEEK